ncbi:MAG: hypothetical protein JW874_01550, partial [Spirochaetales bacterium]|nr:hypothetical protein [Spirochaetales bacterium]
MLFLLMILFSCLMPGSSPPGITVPPPDSESITLTGETLNDGFAVQNSDTIIFGFERITGLGIGNSDGDSEISINLPAGISTFSVTKDGAEGCVDGLTDTTGSFIIVSTSNPGALTILDFGEAEGTSLFIFTIEAAAALPLWSCDWIVNPSTNVDIRFIRTIPDISINCPSSVLSGTAGIILDAGESEVSYEGTITPVPSITSYAWTQTAGPAVTLNGEDTAILTFNAPVVATDTDLTFQLTVTDDAGLTAEKEIILSVLAPDYESITLLGETLNDGFTIDNSDTILFGFERVTGLGVNNREGDTEIAIILPTGVCKYSILKDGVICEVDGITDSSGSLIVANTSNPGSILIMDFGESEGTSFFAATIEAAAAVPVGSCDWQVRPLTDTNADIRFVRAIPDISIDFPSTVLSGAAGVILNADESKVSYAGTITPAPSISSFSWTQTAG